MTQAIIIILILSFIVGVFSYMIKSGVFDSDSNDKDTKIDSLGTEGVVSMPEPKHEVEYHPDILYKSKMQDLLDLRKGLKNHLYKIEGNPDKVNERISVKKQLAMCETTISNLMAEKSIPNTNHNENN